MIRGVRAIAR